MSQTPAQRIAQLRQEIAEHDRRYYQEAAPTITDLQYDQLVADLRRLEQQHPDLVTPDSPTQRVGGQPVDALHPVEHRVPMLSIDNTYDVEELRKYGQRVAKLLPGEKIEWVVELKIDGVAVSLTYENGLLVQGATRGNGRVGDDVTHNMPHGPRSAAAAPRQIAAGGARGPRRNLYQQFGPGPAQPAAAGRRSAAVCQQPQSGGRRRRLARSAHLRQRAGCGFSAMASVASRG